MTGWSSVLNGQAPRLYAPLAALIALALLALVIAAQAGLALCKSRVSISVPSMDAMPGMPMGMPAGVPMHHVAGICPVVLALILASALLAAVAIVLMWRDPHRALSHRTLLRSLARLSIARTSIVLAGLAASAVAVMIAVDGAGAPGIAGGAMLAALIAGGSLAATLLSLVAGRVALAMCERVLLAIVAALTVLRDALTPRTLILVPVRAIVAPAESFAAGRGLRAPPFSVR